MAVPLGDCNHSSQRHVEQLDPRFDATQVSSRGYIMIGRLKKCLAAALLVSWAQIASAGWQQAETSHFRVYSDGNTAELRQMATLLEDFDSFLRKISGTKQEASPNKLDVYLVRSSEGLRVARAVSGDVVGYYSATAGGIAAFSMRRDQLDMQGDEVLLHEYAHHFMLQYHPAAYPAWYVEGFAEYVMTAKFTDTHIDFGQFNENRAYWLANGNWLPFVKILEGRRLSPSEWPMFYPESWLAVHYLFRTPGKTEALLKYLRARSAGEEDKRAFLAAFGTDYAGFDTALRRYMRGKITFSRLTRASAATPPQIALKSLPDSAEDLLLAEAALKLGQDGKRGATLLARVRKSAARHPGDGYATRVLARAEIMFGDTAKGAALVDQLLGASGNDADLLFLRGLADLVQARAAKDPAAQYMQARRWFAKAFKADPHHVPTLVSYVETFVGRALPDSAVDVLLAAQALAPQVRSITVDTATALMQRKDFAAAETLLLPLAADPHQNEMAERIRILLEHAKLKVVPAFGQVGGEGDAPARR